MGLFGNIVSGVTKAVKSTVSTVVAGVQNIPKAATQVLDLNKALFTNPITTIINPAKGIAESNKLSPVAATVKIAATTATAAAALLVPTTAVGRTTAVAVASSLVPKSVVGKVAAAAAVPIVAGAVISKPLETTKAVVEAPANLANLGGNIAELVAEPSLEKAKDIFKENPVLATTAAVATVAAVGLTTAGVVSSVLNTQAVKAQTQALKELPTSTSSVLPSAVSSAEQTSKEISTSTPTVAQTPITPATEPLIATAGGGTSTTTRRRKPASKPTNQYFNQKVAVVVQNRQNNVSSKRYIKNEVLARAWR